jgi:hypothetical protein
VRHQSNEGFLLSTSEVQRDIFIPRYYDPRIEEDLEDLSASHHLASIDEMVAAKQLRHDHGTYIPKINYGAGPVPYIRTSDLANWEIKASPKHGIPVDVYLAYQKKQNVQAKDILFVHEGTYLIGSVAMITPYDGEILYQHHLAKFRVLESAPFGPYFLLAALESPIVQRQVRSKQFSADIIDSVVGRLGEVMIPYPKEADQLKALETVVEGAILNRARLREKLTYAVREIDGRLQGDAERPICEIFEHSPGPRTLPPDFLVYRSGHLAFTHTNKQLVNDILIPKYYDPTIQSLAKNFETQCEMVSVADLQSRKLIQLTTGDEVGKMAYGTGSIPFVRTSDLASWELKREAKQGVSEGIYKEWKQDVKAEDILLIRDGTYLVGSSVFLFESDLPLLYCGGMYRIRSLDHEKLPPALLYALLNIPFVRRQLRNKQFTRDVIDTIGRRLNEVLLPVPKSEEARGIIAKSFKELLAERNRLRLSLTTVVQSMFPSRLGAQHRSDVMP